MGCASEKKRTLKTSTSFSLGYEVLLCPICGFEYIHPLKVKVSTHQKTVIIDAESFHFSEDKMAVRRSGRIVIEYACEDGHHGNIILQFHKGNTFVEHEELPPISGWKTL